METGPLFVQGESSEGEAPRPTPARMRTAAVGAGVALLGVAVVAALGFAGGKVAAADLQGVVAEFHRKDSFRGRAERVEVEPALTQLPLGFDRKDKELAYKLLQLLDEWERCLWSQQWLPDDLLLLTPQLGTATEKAAIDAYDGKVKQLVDKLKKEPVSNLRVLLAAADGAVVFDSSKGTAGNTLQLLNLKKINENHNTRPEIMSVELFGEDSFSKRLSTSTKTTQVYVAHLLGKPGAGKGMIRFSLEAPV